MAYVICDNVTKGLRNSERTVSIKDINGRKEYLRVEFAFLTEKNGQYLLPVGKIAEDNAHNALLIELPQESESGRNRLWVKFADIVEHAKAMA